MLRHMCLWQSLRGLLQQATTQNRDLQQMPPILHRERKDRRYYRTSRQVQAKIQPQISAHPRSHAYRQPW